MAKAIVILRNPEGQAQVNKTKTGINPFATIGPIDIANFFENAQHCKG